MTETDTPGTTERGKPGLTGVPAGHKSTSAGVFFQRWRMDRNGKGGRLMLGIGRGQVKTNRTYTIEELYAAIRDHVFPAGSPALAKHGLCVIIAFPPIDRRNQVWILPQTGKGERRTSTFRVQRGEAACASVMAADPAYTEPSEGIFPIGSLLGGPARACRRLAERTAEELRAMNL